MASHAPDSESPEPGVLVVLDDAPIEPRLPRAPVPADPAQRLTSNRRFTPDQSQARHLLAALLRGRGWTYRRIAEVFGVSIERARQLVRRGILHSDGRTVGRSEPMNHSRVVNLRDPIDPRFPGGPKWRDVKAVGNSRVVVCDRTSKFGNPFLTRSGQTREQVIVSFRAWLRWQPSLIREIREELSGDVWLGCWCAPKSCHCDVLGAVADGEAP